MNASASCVDFGSFDDFFAASKGFAGGAPLTLPSLPSTGVHNSVGFVCGFLNSAMYVVLASILRSRARPSVSPPRAGKPSPALMGSYPSRSSDGMPEPVTTSLSASTRSFPSLSASPSLRGVIDGTSGATGGTGPTPCAILRKEAYAVGGSPRGHLARSRSKSQRVCDTGACTSTPNARAASFTDASRFCAYGSVSNS